MVNDLEARLHLQFHLKIHLQKCLSQNGLVLHMKLLFFRRLLQFLQYCPILALMTSFLWFSPEIMRNSMHDSLLFFKYRLCDLRPNFAFNSCVLLHLFTFHFYFWSCKLKQHIDSCELIIRVVNWWRNISRAIWWIFLYFVVRTEIAACELEIALCVKMIRSCDISKMRSYSSRALLRCSSFLVYASHFLTYFSCDHALSQPTTHAFFASFARGSFLAPRLGQEWWVVVCDIASFPLSRNAARSLRGLLRCTPELLAYAFLHRSRDIKLCAWNRLYLKRHIFVWLAWHIKWIMCDKIIDLPSGNIWARKLALYFPANLLVIRWGKLSSNLWIFLAVSRIIVAFPSHYRARSSHDNARKVPQ